MGSTSTELCRMTVEWGSLALEGETEHKGGPQQTRVFLHVSSPDQTHACVALGLEHLMKLEREIREAIEWVTIEEYEARKRERKLSVDE